MLKPAILTYPVCSPTDKMAGAGESAAGGDAPSTEEGASTLEGDRKRELEADKKKENHFVLARASPDDDDDSVRTNFWKFSV